jgi:acetate kinase
MTKKPNILVFNAGSSSLKFAHFHCDGDPRILLSGATDGIGSPDGRILAYDASGETIFTEQESFASVEHAARRAIALFGQFDCPPPDAVGHRFVHGGRHLIDHAVIDDAVLKHLDEGSQFAPQHNPAALAIFTLAKTLLPGLPHVACLDTVFHKTMPAIARHFPLPADFAERGIVRYGFHGLSCESIIRRLPRPLPPRIVIAHLGSGCSITAVRDGVSIDNSMGLTPIGGMMMQTRSGDLDPGLLTYLLRSEGYTPASLEMLLSQKAGLLGVSGSSRDLGALCEMEAKNESAKLAVAMFCTSATKQIAGMISVLSGLDLLIFTGGIGEHHHDICSRIASALSWMGHFETITTAPKEEEQIAIHATRLTHANERPVC